MLIKTLRPDDGPNKGDELVTVATFQTAIEADLVREELEASGIDAAVSGGTIAQTFITMPETGVTVEVRASDAERAREVISAVQRTPITDDEINAASDASVAEGTEGPDGVLEV